MSDASAVTLWLLALIAQPVLVVLAVWIGARMGTRRRALTSEKPLVPTP
jgi:hypothetical protein